MMPSNGPPTPQGVGGPTPPLVSRGSEEEGGKRISLEGLPSPGRKGYSASTAWVEEEVSPPNREVGECPRNLKGDEESPPTHGKKGECTSPQKGKHNLRGGRPPGKNMVTANSKDLIKRHEEPIRAGNCACWTPGISFPLRGPDDPLGE